MRSSRRWLLYALAALATAAAMVGVDRPADDLLPSVAARPAAAPARVAAVATSRWALPRREATGIATDDPFDEGIAEPAVPVPVPMREQAMQAPQRAAASAPPLPFSYLGQWVEKGVTTAFLGTPQGINVAAQAGATLDGTYRVEHIDEQGMTLRYLPLNAVQTLSFAASRDAGPVAAPVAATAAPPADTGSEETN
ncbi:hypothetical protein [Pelomonas sp. KK5]|uniref:hypothetical protein n=1 Tax=Pelomonas sp. KK5 TaxID=1855730 RepID=UPI00097BB1E3|nr:hypothetical protein [Pelomonas sp. KK5]